MEVLPSGRQAYLSYLTVGNPVVRFRKVPQRIRKVSQSFMKMSPQQDRVTRKVLIRKTNLHLIALL